MSIDMQIPTSIHIVESLTIGIAYKIPVRSRSLMPLPDL